MRITARLEPLNAHPRQVFVVMEINHDYCSEHHPTWLLDMKDFLPQAVTSNLSSLMNRGQAFQGS